MSFSSDTASGVHPKILEALHSANAAPSAPSYGDDALTRQVEAQFDALFETKTAVFLVPTGTAANALTLAALTPPFGSILCHEEAHIHCDEAGAPEFYTHGAKLVPLAGAHGRLSAETLETHLTALPSSIHQVQAHTLSLTQATEAGTVYPLDHIEALCRTAKRFGLHTHMDGARFANALHFLGCSPAQMTWKAGIDALCFGATKNGTLGVEAIVVFDQKLAETIAVRRKRAGHLFSKMRFLSAQMQAYLSDDLWLHNAAHANAMAQKLKDGLLTISGATLEHPVEANELFITLPESVLTALEASPHSVHRWNGPHGTLVRMVTSFNTSEDTINDCLRIAQGAASTA